MPSDADRMPVEISLREVTRETVVPVCKLRVKPDQERFVAPNGQSMAEASFAEDAWFRAIYADEEPVGFVMLSLIPDQPEYSLWRFMIDQRHQGRGFGRRAMELVLESVRSLPRATEFLLSCHPDAHGSADFYRKLGFRETGEMLDGEQIMSLDLASGQER